MKKFLFLFILLLLFNCANDYDCLIFLKNNGYEILEITSYDGYIVIDEKNDIYIFYFNTSFTTKKNIKPYSIYKINSLKRKD